MLKEAASDADLLRLMSEVLSLREQVAQAELRVKRSRQSVSRPVAVTIFKRRLQKHR